MGNGSALACGNGDVRGRPLLLNPKPDGDPPIIISKSWGPGRASRTS